MKKLMLAMIAALPALAVSPAMAQRAPTNLYAQQQPPAAQTAAQLDMDAVPRISSDGVRKVQQLLRQKGFDPVKIDGIFGPLTKTALSGFQERYGIKTRGEIDNQTLFALGAVELAGQGN